MTDDEYEASDAGRRYADPLRSPWTWAALLVCALLWVALVVVLVRAGA